MPTKPNRAGQPQNYVPAGNGDASGEYGDNATGSNIHFKSFAKPKDDKNEIEPNVNVKIEDKPKEEKEEESDKSFEKWIETDRCSDIFKDYARDIIKICPKDNKSLLNNLVQDKDLSISQTSGVSYCDGSNNIYYNYKVLNSDHRTKGETFFHELGHGIDENYSRVFEEDSMRPIRSYRDYYKSASDTFITSTGKTLNDSLLRLNPSAKDRFKQAQADYDEERKKFIEEFDKDLIDVDNRLNKLNKYCTDLRYKIYEETGKWDNEYSESEEHKELVRLLRKKYDAEDEFKKQVGKHWGDVSDMFSMQKVGDFGFVHSSSYASHHGYRGKEFFAECFSAESCDPEAVKLIQKYFPEGWQAYKETKEAIMKAQKENKQNGRK